MGENTFDRISGNFASIVDRRSVLRQAAALLAVAAGTAGVVGAVETVSASKKHDARNGDRHGNNGNNECVNRCRAHGGHDCHETCRRNR